MWPSPGLTHCLSLLATHTYLHRLVIHSYTLTTFSSYLPHVGPGQSFLPSLSFHLPTSPPSTPSVSILYFFLFSFLTRFIYFLLFHSFSFYQTLPLCFQAGCRRRRLNLALVSLCLFYVICILYLRMRALFVVFDLVLSCGVIVVSPLWALA